MNHRGYTLVELIVSVAIFSIVMLVAGAAFLSMISLDRQARATNDVVTNLSYVIDSMERSIRTGTTYQNVSGGSSFCFVDSESRTIVYRRVTSGSTGYIEQCISTSCSPTSSSCYRLTDPRVNVQSVAFYSRGTTVGDTFQPFVIFTTRGTLQPSPSSPTVTFVIESAATQRLIDL